MSQSFRFLAFLSLSFLFFNCGNDSDFLKETKLYPVEGESGFQFIDKEGKIIINPQFKEASLFREGLALVKNSEDKYGFIAEDGKYVIQPKYLRATVFSEGLAWVVLENGAPSTINKEGKTVFTLKEAGSVFIFKEGLAAFSSDKGDWGFVDKQGKVLINPQFGNVSFFSEEKCAVANKESKWGYINKEGKIVINYQFESAHNFTNGCAVVKSNSKWGLIDEDGKFIINPQFDMMSEDGEFFVINQGDKYGWCNKDGQIIINPQFDDFGKFRDNDLAPVKSGEKWGYVDKDGKIIINPQFDRAFSFMGDLAIIQSTNAIGFINKEGKYVINPQYKTIPSDLEFALFDSYLTYAIVESDYLDVSSILFEIKKVISEIKVNGFKDKASTIMHQYSKGFSDLSTLDFFSLQHLHLNSFKISPLIILDYGILYISGDYTVIKAFEFSLRTRNSDITPGKLEYALDEIAKGLVNFNGFVKIKELSSKDNETLNNLYFGFYSALKLYILSNKQTKVEIALLNNISIHDGLQEWVVVVLYSLDDGTQILASLNSSSSPSETRNGSPFDYWHYTIGNTSFEFNFLENKVKYEKGSGYIRVEPSGESRYLYYEKDASGKLLGTYLFNSDYLSGEYRRAKDNKNFKFTSESGDI